MAGARKAFVINNSWPHFAVTFEGGIYKAYQYLSIAVAARTLEHRPNTVQTNKQSAIQIEIAGHAKDAPGFSKAYLDGIAALMRWIEENASVGRTTEVMFVSPGQETRLSDERWLAYKGWCGHQHVPHNSHEDPGAINIDYLLARSSTGFVGGSGAQNEDEGIPGGP
ncbi:MAG: N-acetylmuramoyl-L-alanine amidase [Candidatus Eremiobacteraeota bacterium]|nr:N-acetylmuramoyl-L-alanine amidase [Candidatus Eremiobacteraeota bacterium]